MRLVIMNISEFGIQLCNYCINVLECGCKALNISYEWLNVILFIIVQPLCILMFAIAALFYLTSKRKSIRIISHCAFACGITLTLLDVAIIAYCVICYEHVTNKGITSLLSLL